MSKPNLLISEQLLLEPPLPKVLNNVDYQRLEAQFRRIDQLLRTSGTEQQLVESALERRLQNNDSQETLSLYQQVKFQESCRQAIRCNIARCLHGESYRSFSTHLAESRLLQWFCRIDCFDDIQVPTKSSLQRFSNLFSTEEIERINGLLLDEAAVADGTLGLAEPIDLDTLFMDSTCVKANIHFPVDWVLLRDGVRTLIAGIESIRAHGLKHRMPTPETLIRALNGHCMEMTKCRRRPDSKKNQKRILRRMKKAVDQVARHARRYLKLLAADWSRTDWSQAQAQQVIQRMENILAQLPAAKKQAHERIIGQRQVPNADKILSLYEPDIHVIVRGKAGEECEFGNGLLLAENPQGLLVHWEFYREQPPSDATLVAPVIEKVEARHDIKIAAVAGDRGFETKANVRYLEKREIFNGLSDRQPRENRGEIEKEVHEGMQRRRAQTEARIGIFKNNFLGRPMRMKGFDNREQAIGWAVLTHNLWVLARLPKAEEQSPPESLAQAA